MGTLSKDRVKYIRSLKLRKSRKEERVFLAEGPKLIGDLLGHFPCKFLAAASEWLGKHSAVKAVEIIEVGPEDLSRVSLLKNPRQVLVLLEQLKYEIDTEVIRNSLYLALDNTQDPDNPGTIICLADWLGIEHILCSPNTVDASNPKAIQATMGGTARVKVHYIALSGLIYVLGNVPVYDTFLDGKNMCEQPLSKNGIIVMGNEGNGIGAEVEKLVNRKLYIPNYPRGWETSESLNVATATTIVCAGFRRQAAL